MKKIVIIISFLVINQLTVTIFSQSLNKSIDTVPRDRLITDSELIALFDKSYLGSIDNITIDDINEYFFKRLTPKYFFDKNNFDKNLESFLKQFPNEKKSIKNKVKDYQTSYGNDLDWLLPGKDLVGRLLTPNTIRYTARFPLAYEYAIDAVINDDSEPINNLLLQLKDFINDYENGQVESEENDVFERFYAGHRTRNLLFAHNILESIPEYRKNNQIFMLKVFLLHGAKLIDVCENFHWGNHQLHGLAGLYEMTTMYPEFPVMKLWNKLALKTIMEHIEREIKSDGFQFERASHYYKLDIMNYFRIYKISQVNNIELPKLFMERFNSMFEAFVNLSLPSKKLPVLQDAQDKYKTQKGKFENNDAAELNDPKESLYMTLGAFVFKNSVFKYFGDETISPDIYWFFTNNDRKKYAELKVQKPSVGSIGLEDSKYYVMRTGWEKDSYYMIVDGGLAQYKPDHTHGGILGVFANIAGIDMLPTYRVKYSQPTYRYLKNSFVKNVAIADNVVQGNTWKSNNARTGFGHWLNLPQPKVNEWFASENYDYFSGIHNAYDSIGVKYTRSIIFYKPAFWLFLDEFKGDQLHSYQQLWQGEFDILKDCNGIVKSSGDVTLYIIQSDFTNMNLEPYSKYGYNSFKFEKEGVSDYTFSTIVFPLVNGTVEPTIREFERNDYKQILVRQGNKKYSYYFNKGEILKLDEIETDAKIICSTYDNDKLVSFMVYNGSYCNLEGVKSSESLKSNYEVQINNGISITKKIKDE